MSTTVNLRVNDTAPNIPIICKYKDGSVVPLSGCTVNFYIVNTGGTTTNTGHTECDVTDAAAGECAYDLFTGDIPVAGTYTGVTKVTLSNGELQSEIRNHVLVVSGEFTD